MLLSKISKNKKLNKKAQASQVFVYIAAVIIFSVILFFGYTTITDFISKGEDVALLSFKSDLESAFNNIYSDYGTSIVYNINRPMKVPSGIEKVCFLNLELDYSNQGICTQDSEDYNGIICDAWETYYNRNDPISGWRSSDQNVFLIPKNQFAIKIPRIKIKNNTDELNYVCFKVLQNRIDFMITGRGSHAEINIIKK